jgi:quaternary ammonium compound-resistance protein SugE
LRWTAAFLTSVTLSMGLLELAARSIPMGTAYAVWGGIGAIGTLAVGIAGYGEPASLLRAGLVLVIVGCIAALELTA